MNQLDVYADADLVGHLVRAPEGLVFTYASDWLAQPHAAPITPDMPLALEPYRGPRVDAFFENLLPEGGVRAFIAQAAHISPDNVFGLLERFGGDTAGALSLVPKGQGLSGAPNYLPVTAADIRDWFATSRGLPLSIGGAGGQARMSLSGAQDKMAVFISPSGGLAIPLGTAPSSHIVKPSITHRPDVPLTAVNETLVMQLAAAAGMEVPAVRYAADLDAIVVERYDRVLDSTGRIHRVHQNDLCQLLSIASGMKYESEGGPSLKTCFHTVVSSSVQPAVDKKRLIEWVIFNALVGNMDSHAKNLAMVASGRGMRLAPFYDLLCTAVYPNLSRRFAFKVGGEHRPAWFMPRHWDRFALDIGARPQFVRATAARLSSVLPELATVVALQLKQAIDDAGAAKIIDAIEAYVRRMCLKTTARLQADAQMGSRGKGEDGTEVEQDQEPDPGDDDGDGGDDDDGFRPPGDG